MDWMKLTEKKYRKLQNEIRLFAKENPKSRILVSCRNNFNPFEIENKEENQANLNKFKICFLNEITEKDILILLKPNQTRLIH